VIREKPASKFEAGFLFFDFAAGTLLSPIPRRKVKTRTLKTAESRHPVKRPAASGGLLLLRTLAQRETRFLVLLDEACDDRRGSSQQKLNLRARAVTGAQPNHLGRRAEKNTSLLEIRVLGNDRQAIFPRELPYRGIVGSAQPTLMHMQRTGIRIREQLDEARRKVSSKSSFTR